MKTDQDRIKSLTEYVQGLLDKENGRELYFKYRTYIERVTPQEVFEIFHLIPVSYTHLRAHETVLDLVCRLLLAIKNNNSLHPTTR